MNIYILDCSPEMPELQKVQALPDLLNAWVKPNGDCYFFDGVRHLLAAKYIGIMLLDIHPDNLKKGTFFREDFDTRLLNLGWLSIKNLSWLSEGKGCPKFHYKNSLTRRQMTVVFDYCQKHDYQYPEEID